MVPLVSYAAEAFLTSLRSLIPEYRSTGEYRGTLHDFADGVGNLAEIMRSEVLARTIYNTADFQVRLDPSEVIYTQDLNGIHPIAISPTCSRFPVGALDLRYHDNTFFQAFLNELVRLEFYGWPHETKKGLMDFRWIPPAVLTVSLGPDSKFDGFKIANPEACATLANAQSEQDYADLFSVSGYPQLLQLATLLRNETTDPDISQTVSIALPALHRRPLGAHSVTVESEPVPLTGKITSMASREAQKCTASISVSTQPIERNLGLQYKVRIRTLNSFWGAPLRWHEPKYANFQFLHYERVLTDPNFMELVFDQMGFPVGESEVLIEGGSKAEGYPAAIGTVTIKAHTFDWWIPILPPYSLTISAEDTKAKLRSLGQPSVPAVIHPPKLAYDRHFDNNLSAVGSKTEMSVNSFPVVDFMSGEQDWTGQHRDLLEKNITLKYKITWKADQMQIELEADPADRNYVAYVVVEEKLQGGKGNVLHTAMPVQFNGLLTYVPGHFFDEENAAIEKARKAADDFNRHYGKSATPGIGGPVSDFHPGDFGSLGGITKILEFAELHAPELLERSKIRSEINS